MTTNLPCVLEQSMFSVATGAAIRGIANDIILGGSHSEGDRMAIEVLTASIFVPVLARERHIAMWLGRPLGRVQVMGRRLRRAGTWVGDAVADRRYEKWFSDDLREGSIQFGIDVMIAKGELVAWIPEGGEECLLCLPTQNLAPPEPTFYAGEVCMRCGHRERYFRTCHCVHCQRTYSKNYMKRPKRDVKCWSCRPAAIEGIRP